MPLNDVGERVTPAAAAASPSAPADGRLPLLAFVADEASEVALRGGIVDLLANPDIRRGDIRTATKLLEKEASPRVILVDIGGLEQPVEALEALAQVCSPDVKVLVVGERNDIGFYRTLVQGLGVTDYLPKPLTRDAVEHSFGPHIAGFIADATRERGGQVIAVMGARGGVGATTVAVNLAAHLAMITHGHVAILDLHLQAGAAALMLGAKTGAGLRVALEEPDRVDGLFLDRAAVEVGERLRLIAAEEGFQTEIAPSNEGVASLLNLLRRKFNHVVVDLPLPHPPAMRQALTLARHRVVVLGPDLVSIRDTLAIRRLCAQLGVPRIVTVLNRAGAPGALKPELLKEGLGEPPDFTLPELAKHLPRAANLGHAGLRASPQLRRALEPLTVEVSGVPGLKTTAAKRGLLAWMRR